MVDHSGENVYAIIPGVAYSENDSHCFIQVLNGQTGSSFYHHFPIDQFWASKKKFEFRIGPNIFRHDSVELNLEVAGKKTEAKIRMKDITPWPVTLLTPGIMGWYAFVPFMECYHGVISLDHQLNGFLKIDEETIDFNNGRGYIEKDWGKSFPKAYIWLQCNHFDEEGISLTASIANIPWLNGSFRGFIIGLLLDGKLYRFTTYTKATVQDVQITDDKASFVVSDKKYLLKIEAAKSGGGTLHAPARAQGQDQMEMRDVVQSLTGKVVIELREHGRNRGRLIYGGTGHHAAVEISGDIAAISDARVLLLKQGKTDQNNG